VISFTPWQLYPRGKNPSYPFYRRLGGPQSRSGRGGEEKSSLPLPESSIKVPIHNLLYFKYITLKDVLMRVVLADTFPESH
jgi:hypothetical protein